ncbi:MAG TPA: hypothetical protein DCX53_10945 [Anaerolineae bacterium]|nr:hypothetical protein [Anaerolineae bacterium]
MKKIGLTSILLITILAFTNIGSASSLERSKPAIGFSFAAIGDVPYLPTSGGRQVYPATEYESVIAHINEDEDIEFSIHIGDIKGGSTLCEDAVYSTNLEYFNSFVNPLIFTPGDNEWTDCHRANNGSMDPLDRLSLIRNLFYDKHNKSLGQNTITLKSDQKPYVENAAWTVKPAMFITLHQPGSNNNLNRTPDMDLEYAARNASNMAFLEKMLKQAEHQPHIRLVVIASQANPFERFLESGQGYTESGYADFIVILRAFVADNPDVNVLYIGGDTHLYRVDQPLTDVYPSPAQLTPAGTSYPNFTRLEVFGAGSALSQWAKVSVNPDGTFSISPQLVP